MATHKNISEEDLRRLYTEENNTIKECARYFETSETTINRKLDKYNIVRKDAADRNSFPPFSKEMESILIGSLLGNGMISRSSMKKETCRFRENSFEKDYLQWKWEKWKDYVDSPLQNYQSKNREKEYSHFHTRGHRNLLSYRNMFYPFGELGGEKRIESCVIPLVDDLALTIWYLDKGSLRPLLCIDFEMDCPSRENAFKIFEKFGIKVSWTSKPNRKDTSGLFKIEDEERFKEIISSHVPECMKFKLD